MATEQDHWEACPPGELTRTVELRQSRRRRKVIDRVAVVAASLMVLIAVGGFTLGMFSTDPSDPLAGLACTFVVENMPTYIDGGMEPEMRTRMATHIENCPMCNTKYEAMISSISSFTRSAILFASVNSGTTLISGTDL